MRCVAVPRGNASGVITLSLFNMFDYFAAATGNPFRSDILKNVACVTLEAN